MSVTLKQLAVLTAVIDQDGFGAAAEELGVDQSSVSHSVAALEKTAGAPLVNRSGPLRPTELGCALLPHARTALAATRAIEALINEYRENKPSGMVKIAASPTASHRLLPRLLTRCAQAMPDVDVRVFEGDDDELEEWLSSGVVDCAILIDPEIIPADGVELVKDKFRAVLRNDHPFSSLGQVGLPELLEDPLLVSSGGCEPQIKKLQALSGVGYSPAQRVRELSTLLSMVESNIGVAIMPSLASSMLPSTLVMVDISPCLERQLVFTGPSDRPWHPQVKRMLDVIASMSAD